MPDGPLADPGVRYSGTGLIKRARTQKGWGNHRGMAIAGTISDSRNTVNVLAVSAQPPYRDSNPVDSAAVF